MNRLQKKCFIVSAGVHLLLFIILLVGPAFLSSKSHSEDVQALDFYPSKLIDAAFAGGGNRNAKPPAAIQPPSQPPALVQRQSPPEKSIEPDPPKVTVKVPKIDPDSVEMAEPKRHKPQVSMTLVSKPSPHSTQKKNSAENTQAVERQLTAARQKLAKQLAQAAQSIRDGTSSATTIEDRGPGGGGPSYASYAAWVKTVYENAWEAPEETATDDAITKVIVTIACDGTVLSSRISKASGDSPVDKSVQRTLDRVTFIRQFPDGVKEKQRTYIINFNLKAKRGLA